MPTNWGNPGDTSQSLERLANLIDEMADSTNDDEKLRVTNDPDDPSSITNYASQFNDLNTAERSNYISIDSSQGLSDLRDVIKTSNGGSVTSDSSLGEIQLLTDTQSQSSASAETARWGQYNPGYEAEVGLGMRLPQQPTDNGDIRWGYFNGTNGFYFGYDSGGLYVALLREGTQKEKVYRENWNGRDPDDISGVTFEPSDGAIFQINFAWYGYGSIEFSIIFPESDNTQRVFTVHTFAVEEETSITNPNQPIRVHVDNNSSSNSLETYLGGRQFSIIGNTSDNFRVSSQDFLDVSVANGSWTHIGSIRRKSSSTRRANLVLDGIEASSGDDIRLAAVLNTSLSSTNYGSFDLIPSDETVAEVSSAGTFDGIGGGRKIVQTFIPVSQNAKLSTSQPVRELGQPIPRNQPVSLIAQGVGTSTTVDAVLRVREEW